MSKLEVVVLGTGDAFSQERSPTAFLVKCDGYALAVDCPDGYRAVLKRAGEQVEAVDAVVLTHVHGDHMNGLEGWAFYRRFVEQRRVALAASPEVRSVLWEQRLEASMGSLWDGRAMKAMAFEDYFDFVALPWDAPTTLGPLTIRTRRTVHHVPTSALLVECQGRVVGFSADTAFDPELLAFLASADLILHETNHGPAHTDIRLLEALPEALRAKMRLVHYPDGFADEPRQIALARAGETLVVA